MKILLAVMMTLSVTSSVWALTAEDCAKDGKVLQPGDKTGASTVPAEAKVDRCVVKAEEKSSSSTDVCKDKYNAGGVTTGKTGEAATTTGTTEGTKVLAQ